MDHGLASRFPLGKDGVQTSLKGDNGMMGRGAVGDTLISALVWSGMSQRRDENGERKEVKDFLVIGL